MLAEQAEFVPPPMPEGYMRPLKQPEMTPAELEEKKARYEKEKQAKLKYRPPPDLSKMNPEQREEYEDRMKKREERKVRQEKMEEWALGADEKAKADKAKAEEKNKYDDGRLFKIYHEEKD